MPSPTSNARSKSVDPISPASSNQTSLRIARNLANTRITAITRFDSRKYPITPNNVCDGNTPFSRRHRSTSTASTIGHGNGKCGITETTAPGASRRTIAAAPSL